MRGTLNFTQFSMVGGVTKVMGNSLTSYIQIIHLFTIDSMSFYVLCCRNGLSLVAFMFKNKSQFQYYHITNRTKEN